MPIASIHTYLVHPHSPADAGRPVRGVPVALEGKLFATLEQVYSNSDRECDIEIVFTPKEDAQANDCRDLVTSYVRDPTIENGRGIAARLRTHTDGRSKIGLLFLIYGKEGRSHKLVISRYPTNQAILAEEGERGLNVEFLERVFMRSAFAYKAAVFQDASLAEFWSGRAVDKQSSNPASPSPDYWIRGFLGSDFLVTPAAGTRRLAVALRQAITTSQDLEVKQELIAASTLARRQGGQRISVDTFCERFHLSDEATATLRAQLPTPALAAQQFSLDATVFDREVAYRNLQLDSGVVITAPAGQFDGLVQRTPADRADGTERFSVTGKVVDEKLRRGPAV